MPALESSETKTGVDDEPVVLENCYHVLLGNGDGGEFLPSKVLLSRLSFRWQVSLLGTLVVILFLAVLLAIVATLRYTKSAVLNTEKRRLAETARNLAQEYENRAESARQAVPLDDPSSGASRQLLGLMARVVLQNSEGVGGGFYSLSTDAVTGSFYPAGVASPGSAEDSDLPQPEYQAVIGAARTAATTRLSSEQVLGGPTGLYIINAAPIHNGSSILGSAWTIKRISDL